MSSWRSTERPEDFFSESVVSHLVLWVSSCGVLVLFLVGFVLFWFWKTPDFLLSPILQYVGIANQRQNVLMTVRASSVHGMSPQKKMTWHLQAPSYTLPASVLHELQANTINWNWKWTYTHLVPANWRCTHVLLHWASSTLQCTTTIFLPHRQCCWDVADLFYHHSWKPRADQSFTFLQGVEGCIKMSCMNKIPR